MSFSPLNDETLPPSKVPLRPFAGACVFSIASSEFLLNRWMEKMHAEWHRTVTVLKTESQHAEVDVDGIPFQVSWEDVEARPFQDAAERMFLWKEGVATLANTKSIVKITVDVNEDNLKLRALRYVECLDALTCLEGALGIYDNAVVYPIDFYREEAQSMKSEQLPLLTLVWIGLYGGAKGPNAYTFGLQRFGKLNMEVIDSGLEAMTLWSSLEALASFVVTENVTLKQGETLSLPDITFGMTVNEGDLLPDQLTYKLHEVKATA